LSHLFPNLSVIPDSEIKKQRQIARELRQTPWWKEQIKSGVCHYCRQKFSILTMDHKIPLSRGGKSTKSNIVPSCEPCNKKKNNLTPVDMILEQNRISQEIQHNKNIDTKIPVLAIVGVGISTLGCIKLYRRYCPQAVFYIYQETEQDTKQHTEHNTKKKKTSVWQELEEQAPYVFICPQDIPHSNIEVDIAVLSPGIPLSKPFLAVLPTKNWCSEFDFVNYMHNLFCQTTKQPTLWGVTGTNGKSTQAHILNHVSQQLWEHTTPPLGNFGVSYAGITAQIETPEYPAVFPYIVECSSYQLELTAHTKFAVFIFLNIQPDHLNRYQTMEAYFIAKWRGVSLTTQLVLLSRPVLDYAMSLELFLPNCPCVVFDYTPNPHFALYTPNTTVAIPPISLESYPGANYGQVIQPSCHPKNLSTHGWRIQPHDTPQTCLPISWGIPLQFGDFAIDIPITQGPHYQQFLAFCFIVIQQLYPEHIQKTLQILGDPRQYTPLPHRLETFWQIKKKHTHHTWINDSKATNVSSTLVALASVPMTNADTTLYVFIGGQAKQEDYTPLAEFLQNTNSYIFFYGQDALLLSQTFAPYPLPKNPIYATLGEAANAAFTHSKTNTKTSKHIFLLSPACASLDQYTSFNHRGDSFKAMVRHFYQTNSV
jgi:UDP-N-acetylmuramoylalanine-D-glutamate ligase